MKVNFIRTILTATKMATTKRIGLILLMLLSTGCVTQFHGKAKIVGDRQQCEEICAQWEMELAGMVALGEYTDSCICKEKDKTLSVNDIGKTAISVATSAGAGTVGTVMQRRRQEAAQRRAANS